MAATTLVKPERPGFLGHARVIDHLKQKIAQLVLQRRHIPPGNGIGHLMGFFDGVGGDGGEGLHLVPRAAPHRIAQGRHDGAQIADAVRPCGAAGREDAGAEGS